MPASGLPERDAWRLLDEHSTIVDSTLASPLPVHALVHAAKVDDPVARALLAKRNPVLQAALTRSRDEGASDGKLEGKLEALLAVLGARGFELAPSALERVRSERDEAVIDRWLNRAVTAKAPADVFE